MSTVVAVCWAVVIGCFAGVFPTTEEICDDYSSFNICLSCVKITKILWTDLNQILGLIEFCLICSGRIRAPWSFVPSLYVRFDCAKFDHFRSNFDLKRPILAQSYILEKKGYWVYYYASNCRMGTQMAIFVPLVYAQWRRQDIMSWGHRFGVVKRQKIINVYRTTPGSNLYSRICVTVLGLCVIHIISVQ